MPRDAGEQIWIEELLADPIIHLLMRADRTNREAVVALLAQAAKRQGTEGADRRSDQTPQVSIPLKIGGFRPSVGIMLLNKMDEVFVGRRVNNHRAWQMPQGGINEGESERTAALRELKEEIGTSNAVFLGESEGLFRYELPPELIGKAFGGKWRGQEQKWFLMRFEGDDSEINVATEHPEFVEWKWISLEQLADLIVPFKRQTYLGVVREFKSVLRKDLQRR
jgi:putative (di)nucleoside polyphosphate hydrolase